MKKSVLLSALILGVFSCDNHVQDPITFIARVEAIDSNCYSCLISFPFDSSWMSQQLSPSKDHLYNAWNLSPDDYGKGTVLTLSPEQPEPELIPECADKDGNTGYFDILAEHVNRVDYSEGDAYWVPFEKYIRFFNNCEVFIDSILYDSRCPEGSICKQAGNAAVRIQLVDDRHQWHTIILNSNPEYTQDTIIGPVHVSLLEVKPAPQTGVVIPRNKYSCHLLFRDDRIE